LETLVRSLVLAWRFRPHRIQIESDLGRREVRALLTLVSNSPYWGPGVPISPDALVDDGKLDVAIFTATHVAEVLQDVIKLVRGNVNPTRVIRFQTTRLVANHLRRRPLSVHVGVDHVSRTPQTFDIVPRGLAVVANLANVPLASTQKATR
jgi:diacylglycerol kinase (ATP)